MQRALAALIAALFFSLTQSADADLLERIAGNGEMVGQFDGVLVPVDLPTESLADLLPPQLKLERPRAQSTLAVLAIGIQRDVHFVGQKKYLKYRPSETKKYHEVIVAVPNLYLEVGDEIIGPVTHYALLYLNSQKAIDLGKNFWGYPKFAAEMTGGELADADSLDDPVNYLVKADDAPLLEAAFRIGDVDPAMHKAGAFEEVEAMLKQPVVLKHDESWMFKEFDWNLDEASLSPASSDLKLHQGFWGEVQIEAKRQALGEQLGSFRMQTRWRSRQIEQIKETP